MKIKDFLREKGRPIITIGPNESVQAAMQKLVENNIGALPVCDARGTLIGIVSERDLLRECSEQVAAISSTEVKDVMTKDVVVAVPEDDLDHIMDTMSQKEIRHLPIVVGTKVEGMISSRDVIGEQLEECKVEINYLGTLHELAKIINSPLRADEVLHTIVRVAAQAIGAKGCSVMLLDDQKKFLIHTATYGLSDQYLKKGVLMADRILNETLKGKPIAVTDVSNDPRIQYPTEAVKEGIASMLSVPLRLRDELIGLIRIYCVEKQEFGSDTINLLTAIGELSAIAIEKAKMYDSLKKAHDVCRTELGYWQP